MKETSWYDGGMVGKKGNSEPELSLPPPHGTYALVLRFSNRLEIVVGKLGVFHVQPGFYVYVGSAMGPGGLAARVSRHCRREKTRRWHVDYLRTAAQLEEVWYATGKARRECRWAKALRRLPGASMPMTRFGASDCRCQTHLLFFSTWPSLAAFRQRLPGHTIARWRVAEPG